MTKLVASMVALLALVCAPAASAAVAGTSAVDGGGLFYAADLGEANRLTISGAGGMIVFEDPGATIMAGDTCTNETPNRVRCAHQEFVLATLEDEDDVATTDASLAQLPRTFFVGLDGGTGSDTLRAGPAGTNLTGGPGTDVLEGGPITNAIVAIELASRPQPGEVPPQRPEPDQVSCAEPQDDPNVVGPEQRVVEVDTLDDLSGPCPPVTLYGPESIVLDGTEAADTLTGGRGPTRISARGGDDSINSGEFDRSDGGDGNDRLFGLGLLLGGGGDDRLEVGFGPDRGRGDGGSGNDFIAGAEGPDSLAGGTGTDRITGRGGNDRIRSRDGVRDTVRCGAGRDSVSADRADRVASDCERVSR